ncbi:MAG: hypothetical protein A2287_04860 [Candidatus Melainabacteria bacterium RIFOXYA12_FULL_32_12]|nr:MAG: hypothetical protein A2255_06575 [Candidatus Melainabacteria bacterium RIFOXYA2_FULL_32_9]OGI28539.1 MAG: hypothetical protein A2287_04860 [Candidatus Melainabacteria bacterium RIFOXYA12_FULL_32_12]
MTDKINEKVINIFTRHKKQLPILDEEKVIRSDDGFYYICVKKDDNGRNFDEDKLLKSSNDCHYLVKVMVKHSEYPYIYNYKVPGEDILDFLKPYTNNEIEGKILEINKYYPHELA